ncbi:aspartic proteinase nepenthesin-1 [Pyrus ussuriensis x Pyrus communis]|uniref:Aspartic proteinase nepenthesin-1 n=1 Tax=Pyrus ussuriensis x Pyrus communis TaxID=2448454 RepID=A0A5N5G1L1_9ROSA|nr:aspartic proteinase nepenthesin-1 [Pyrus ussuriensis x Pyrus communis]
MKLYKSSCYLVSHKFDNTPQSSDLVLYTGDNSTDEPPISSTRRNETKKKPRSSKLCISRVLLHNAQKNHRGQEAREDSIQIFHPRSRHQWRDNPKDLETKTGLRPYFDISKEEKLEFPELVFRFKGGAKMEFPLTITFHWFRARGLVMLDLTLLRKKLKWLMEDSIEEPKNVDNNNGSVRLRERKPFQYVVECEHWRDLVLCVEEGVLILRT